MINFSKIIVENEYPDALCISYINNMGLYYVVYIIRLNLILGIGESEQLAWNNAKQYLELIEDWNIKN